MIKVINLTSSPVIYGNGKTIGGCAVAQGSKEEFQELIDSGVLKVVGDKTPKVEPQIAKVEPEIAKEVQETLVVSNESSEETGDTMKKIKRRSVTTKGEI